MGLQRMSTRVFKQTKVARAQAANSFILAQAPFTFEALLINEVLELRELQLQSLLQLPK